MLRATAPTPHYTPLRHLKELRLHCITSCLSRQCSLNILQCYLPIETVIVVLRVYRECFLLDCLYVVFYVRFCAQNATFLSLIASSNCLFIAGLFQDLLDCTFVCSCEGRHMTSVGMCNVRSWPPLYKACTLTGNNRITCPLEFSFFVCVWGWGRGVHFSNAKVLHVFCSYSRSFKTPNKCIHCIEYFAWLYAWYVFPLPTLC